MSGDKHKLPSAAQGQVWSMFHKLRNSPKVNRAWCSFVTTIEAPEPCQVESQLALQLLMDRVLKKVLKNKANVVEQLSHSGTSTTDHSRK